MNNKTKHTIIDTKRRDEIEICKYCKQQLTEIDKWTDLMHGEHAHCKFEVLSEIFDK
jgi:hypothetical protein